MKNNIWQRFIARRRMSRREELLLSIRLSLTALGINVSDKTDEELEDEIREIVKVVGSCGVSTEEAVAGMRKVFDVMQPGN